jgi:hypothetical protein
MREENLKALREKIQASFERARSVEPRPRKNLSEDRRLAPAYWRSVGIVVDFVAEDNNGFPARCEIPLRTN